MMTSKIDTAQPSQTSEESVKIETKRFADEDDRKYLSDFSLELLSRLRT